MAGSVAIYYLTVIFAVTDDDASEKPEAIWVQSAEILDRVRAVAAGAS